MSWWENVFQLNYYLKLAKDSIVKVVIIPEMFQIRDATNIWLSAYLFRFWLFVFDLSYEQDIELYAIA